MFILVVLDRFLVGLFEISILYSRKLHFLCFFRLCTTNFACDGWHDVETILSHTDSWRKWFHRWLGQCQINFYICSKRMLSQREMSQCRKYFTAGWVNAETKLSQTESTEHGFQYWTGGPWPVAEFKDPWLGDKVNSDIGLSCRTIPPAHSGTELLSLLRVSRSRVMSKEWEEASSDQ